MSTCGSCSALIKKNMIKLACVDCNTDFHARCVKMSQADIDFLSEQGTVWRCDPCGAERRRSMRLDSSMQEGGLTLEDVMKILNEIREDQKKTVTDFNKSYEALYERINESSETLQSKISVIEGVVNKIEELSAENSTLKAKVNKLEMRVEELEQYSRRNCLEIQGVPEEKGEIVIDTVKKIGSALSMNIEESMIDICHRVGPRSDQRPRGIIVKFVRRFDRDTLLQKRRAKKRDFSTRHLGLTMDTPVFVNESLSPARRILLGQARNLKRERGYKYLWLRNGVILLRKQDGSPVIEIKCQADIDQL